MLVRFWGTRGSIPTPGPSTVRYGGNTSCIEVRSRQSLVIFDCGTGARALGTSLAAEGGRFSAHLFLSHVHWDHIQGFPFFLPAFLPNAELKVYGAAGMEVGLEESLSGQMQYTYFPVRLGDLSSQITFHEVGEESFQASEFAVDTKYLNHTCPAVGYRLSIGGSSVAYLSDHEPFWPHDAAGSPEDVLLHPADRRHVAFAEGADLLIHDAQYTSEEYPARRGWGHSTIEYVVDVALAARVKRLALFHHDPARTDAAIDELVARAQRRVLAQRGNLEVVGAAEGSAIEIREQEALKPALKPLAVAHSKPPARILLLGSAERRMQLREALAPDGYRLNEADLTGQEDDWGVLNPDLIVVAAPADESPVAILRAVNAVAPKPPVVAILEAVQDQLTLRHVGELAADVIQVPFGAPNLRARVRACLARTDHSGGETRLASAPSPERLDVLAVLPPGELAAMLDEGTVCGFRPGEVLFHQGELPQGVYFIRRGTARVVVETPDGRQVTVGQAGPGETIGEMSALDGSPRSATVVATEPVEASYVTRETFRETIRKNPDTSLRLLQLLVRRLRAVDMRMAGLEPTTSLAASPDAETLEQKIQQLQLHLDNMGLTREHLEWYADRSTAPTSAGSP